MLGLIICNPNLKIRKIDRNARKPTNTSTSSSSFQSLLFEAEVDRERERVRTIMTSSNSTIRKKTMMVSSRMMNSIMLAPIIVAVVMMMMMLMLTTTAMMSSSSTSLSLQVVSAFQLHQQQPTRTGTTRSLSTPTASQLYIATTSSAVEDVTATATATATATVQNYKTDDDKTRDDDAEANDGDESKWYATRIQDAMMDYDDVVISLYTRHIVTETYDVAQLALERYMSTMKSTIINDSEDEDDDDNDDEKEEEPTTTTTGAVDPDPFGRLARTISACNATKYDGGTIGWIDRPTSSSTTDTSIPDESSSETEMILPNEVIRQLYLKRPKAGDMYILEAPTSSQFHLVLVSELWIRPPSLSSIILQDGNNDDDSTTTKQKKEKIGSFSGTNISFKRKKLKGGGVTPNFQSQQLQTYEIKTMGCQMNVADSERLEGVLQHQLSLRRQKNGNGDSKTNNNIDVKGIVVDDGSSSSKNNNNDAAASAEDNNGPADVVIWNTCSIRDHAEQKVYDAVGPYASRKRKPVTTTSNNNSNNNNKHSVLIVTGCVAQQEGEDLIKRVPEIDAVIGPQYIPYLPSVLDTILNDGRQVVLTAPNILTHNIQEEQQRNIRQLNVVVDADDENNTNDMAALVQPQIDTSNINEDGINSVGWYSEPVRANTVTAFVNVLFGCNEHCTYCVVPATRGMEQSRTMESILQECQTLADQGYKEITLIGQNIDAYGRDMVPKRNFAQLLEFLNNNLLRPRDNGSGTGTGTGTGTGSSGIERIRYVTSHPRYFTDRVIDAVANLDKVCECFHMPFQAGDNEVLKGMRRGYTYESYMKIIHKIRTSAPDAAICADIIVGFPGETDDAFQRTLDLMNEVKFDNVNSFAYSPRPNTEAALFDGQVAENVKADRLQQVQALANKHGLERSERYLHRIENVLVEDVNPRSPTTQVMGRTRQGRQVYFDGTINELKGRTVPVRITEARTWSLMGEMVVDS